MSDISVNDALTLLRQPLLCVDPGEWVSSAGQLGVYHIAAGLTTRDGKPTSLSVELRYRRAGSVTGCQLTVFLHDALCRHRVYQLEINQSRKRTKDRHRWSHEHIGDKRIVGPEKWDSWSYEEVFRYFCGQTGIEFRPLPRPPFRFQRRKK